MGEIFFFTFSSHKPRIDQVAGRKETSPLERLNIGWADNWYA